jgi:methylmalonyl-CoA epimerase
MSSRNVPYRRNTPGIGGYVITLKRVDHISMGAPDWKAQSGLLERILGFKFLHHFPADGADFEGCVSQVPGTGIEFEVISPAGPGSFVQKFLDEGGPGLHHITVEVHDIHETAAAIERLGMKPFGGIQDDGAWNLTYIHPKDSGGILWQLFVPHKFPPEQDRSTTGGATRVKRVDHVSMAVKDLDRQVEWQQRVFGMEPLSRWSDDQLGYNGCVMRIPNSLLQFEMMEPTRPDSFVQRFIDARRAGMHHICCEVESVERAAEALRANGIEPFGGVIESDWRRHTFIHPKDSGGVLFQLFEEPAEA